jgi:hypothetical protein
MADDDGIAALATGLNEDAKAARRKKGGAAALDASKAHLGGETEEEGTLGDALSSLGEAVRAQEGAATDGLDLTEGAHTAAIDRMENLASEAVLNDKSLVFDARDFLLDQIKSRPKPWSATSNQEQRDVAAACEHAGRELVRKIVEAIAANGKDPVRVLLTKVTLGDDIVIAGKVKVLGEDEEDQAVSLLHSARGKHVMLTVASVEDYSGNAREADTDPDQPGLGFEAGSDDAETDD